jgi:acetylornithine deacetylase/succinyl-diaminopimelate desuccinylase family protein
MDATQITRLLQDLVQIPSVNPQGDPGTAVANTGEAALATYVAEFLKKIAFDVELQEVLPNRPNVIGKFASRGGKRSIAFAPHTDTVSVAGMTIDPFGGKLIDGRLYGRGASDTKGSLAAFMAALANVVRHKEFREGDTDVYLCAVMAEETGNHGARALADRGFRPDFVIAGEPTNCHVVHAHKGTTWLTVTTRGRTAHGSTPELGESAIAKMADVLRYVFGDYQAGLKTKHDPRLGSPTINVGVIRGGSATNIVPSQCLIQLDRRLIPGESIDAVVAEIREALATIPAEVEILGVPCSPMFTAPENPFVQQLARATELPKPLAAATWFCDAAIFAEHQIPAVAFGPGFIAQAHTPDEYIAVAEVERASQIIERFLLAG